MKRPFFTPLSFLIDYNLEQIKKYIAEKYAQTFPGFLNSDYVIYDATIY